MLRKLLALATLLGTLAANGAEAWRPLAAGATAADGAATVTLALAGEDQTVLDVNVRGLFVEPVEVDGRPYTSVSLHAGREVTPGKPAVPVLSVLLAIPRGASPSLEIVGVDVQRLDDVLVAPAQPSPKRCGDHSAGRPLCDRALYGARGPWPLAWAELSELGAVRDVRYVRVVVHPVRVLPSEGASEVAAHLRLVVRHSGGSFLPSPFVAPTFAALYRGLFLNAGAVPDLESALPAAERILVVTPDALAEPLAPFVAWKRTLGFAVEVAPLSTIGTTADALKAFVQSRYEDPVLRPEHVLLVGDIDAMPTNHGIGGSASDFLYSLLDGDDLFSDVLVSRLSVKDAADLALQTQKVVDYEQSISASPESDWLSGALCISSSEGDGASNDDVRSDLICDLQSDHGYAPVTRLFHSLGNDTAANITEAVEEGRGWITYLGHGSGFSWDTTEPPYASDSVLKLQNVGRLPVVMDVSCSNGAFAALGTCFAEAWMRASHDGQPTGAVAIYSASAPTAWDQSAEMAVGLTRAFLQDGVHRWGALAFAGRAALLDLMGTGDAVKEALQQYVVFGDSSLLVRSRRPVELSVSLPDTIPVGGAQASVLVSDPLGLPVPRALVHVTKEGELDVTGYTDEAGRLDLVLAPATSGTLHVTVSAFDAVPWSGTIDVVVTGCGLVKAWPSVITCAGAFDVAVWDHDLNVLPDVPETASVLAMSSAGSSLALDLTETGASTDRFEALVVPADTALSPSHGDVLTLTYADAACEGSPATATASVTVDCLAPVISGIETVALSASSATLRWTTDEPASGALVFGDGVATVTLPAPGLMSSHEVKIDGLTPVTTYPYHVVATDAAGNVGASEPGQVTTPACEPSCSSRNCGPDGCGGSCGTCAADQECTAAGVCFGGPGCDTSANGGCGGCACQACVCARDPYCCDGSWDLTCIGECMADCGGCGACTPLCSGRACGPDGCGGSCGACPGGRTCSADGLCVAPPPEPAIPETNDGNDVANECAGDAAVEELLEVGPDPDATGPEPDAASPEAGDEASSGAGCTEANPPRRDALGLLLGLAVLLVLGRRSLRPSR